MEVKRKFLLKLAEARKAYVCLEPGTGFSGFPLALPIEGHTGAVSPSSTHPVSVKATRNKQLSSETHLSLRNPFHIYTL